MRLYKRRCTDVKEVELDGEEGLFGTGGVQLPRGASGRATHNAVLRSVSDAERAAHDTVFHSREAAAIGPDDDQCPRRGDGDGPNDARPQHPAAGARWLDRRQTG